MPVTFTQIGVAQVVGATSQASIDFVSIPNTFTDLVVKYSLRTSLAGGPFYFDDMGVRFNNNSTGIYSRSIMRSRQGSMGVYSQTDATFFPFFEASAGNANSGSFGHGEMWISNYATSNFKGLRIDGGSETSTPSSEVVVGMISGCFKSTSPITSIKIYSQNGQNIVENSTAYLYGVSKQ
jgi:hypothetical protein